MTHRGGRAGNSLYNSYFVGDLGTSWETSRDICNQHKGRNVENYLVDRRKLRSLDLRVIWVWSVTKKISGIQTGGKYSPFSDDICIFTGEERNREEINLFLSCSREYTQSWRGYTQRFPSYLNWWMTHHFNILICLSKGKGQHLL